MTGFNEYIMKMASQAIGENNTHIKTIDASHQRTHEGEMFTAGYRWENQDDNASLTIAITVPAGINIHTIWDFVSTGKAYFDLYSGTTGVSGGTALTPMNKNTASTKTSTVTVLRDVTVADYGALTLYPISDLSGSGEKSKAIGGGNGMDSEMILDSATTWIFRLQNKGGGAQDLHMSFQFYDTAAA